MLEHIEEDEMVLKNIHNALKSGGGLLITVPQHKWLWSPTDDYACHVRRYAADDLHSKLHEAGFKILRSTSFVSLLLPAMFISRRRSSESEDCDPLSEFQITPLVNRMLEVVLSVERVMIRFGVNFPVGGSRLIVAQRK